ncbi:hypothetical protein AB833_13200 [Chromatiales bacterium (ex Bugula neritina AB1)]|nr:hypothetical protein AB833_13200 [Chromatiales bacterium (ex Bugula neritina AB1)]
MSVALIGSLAVGAPATAQPIALSFITGDDQISSSCEGEVRIPGWATSNTASTAYSDDPNSNPAFRIVELSNPEIYSKRPRISWPSHTLYYELKADAPAGIVSEITAVLTPPDDPGDPDLAASEPQHWRITTVSCVENDAEAPAPEPEIPAYNPIADLDTNPPADGTTYVSTMSPIRSGTGPLCLRPATDADGEPLFNERGNCPIVLYHSNLAFGDFILASNAWNFCASTLPDWEQCISVDSDSGAVTPRWTYDWGNEADVNGPVWLVKSYPEIIYGVKSPDEFSGSSLTETPAETGLPARVDNLPYYRIDYAFSGEENTTRSKEFAGETVYGERNIALESFFHELDGECDVNSLVRNGSFSNQRYEIMLWLDSGPERLPSARKDFVSTIQLDGVAYDVYTKPADPEYIAFVAQQPSNIGQINWSTFIEWTRTYAHQLEETFGRGSNTVRIQDDWCMANILLGTEIWWGSGYFQADEWTIHRTVGSETPTTAQELESTTISSNTISEEDGEGETAQLMSDAAQTGGAASGLQSSGCSVMSHSSTFDPILYLLLLTALTGLCRSQRKQSGSTR